LGRALAELLPHEPGVRGLLAMMLLHESRRAARSSDGGAERGFLDRRLTGLAGCEHARCVTTPGIRST
jgi:predicted RNA polymerase sigma factor